MAVEITSNSVVKIVVRRGQDADRRATLLINGELGYSQDIQRLYIGNGITAGGIPVGNVFFGTVPTRSAYSSLAEAGDTIFDTTTKTLYGFDSGVWKNIHPSFNATSFEQSLNGTWNLSPNLFADAFTFDPVYEPLSVAGVPNKVDFNSNFLSLCAASTSFYFGDIKTRTVTNNFDATVNVSKSLYVNADVASPNQIQILARAPGSNNSTINSVSGTLDIKGRNQISVYTRNNTTTAYNEVLRFDNANNIRALNTGGTQNVPNFRVDGVSRFISDAYYDNNVTITGNLSVYGDVSYLETTIRTTSAVEIINKNQNVIALKVSQLDALANQTLAQFNSDLGNPVVQIKDGPYFGFNASSAETSSTANVSLYGHTLISPRPGITTDGFVVGTGTTGAITFTPGSGNFNVNGLTYLNGNLQFNIASYPSTATTGDSILIVDSTTGVVKKRSASGWLQGSGSYLGGTGTVNYVSKWTTTTALGNSQIFDNGTNVGIGTGTPSPVYKLDVNGRARTTALDTGALDAGAITCTSLASDGDVVAFAVSDARLKNNISTISSPLEKIKKISGVNFEWDTEKQTTYSGKDVGVLAQEIEEVLPEVVTTRKDGYKAVKYEKIIPLLIEAIKELQALVNK